MTYRNRALRDALMGKRFHRLVVIGLIPDAKNPKAVCACDCGSVVTPQRGALRNGKAKSCGCLRRELLSAHVASMKLPEEVRKKRRVDAAAKWQENNRSRAREINRRATRKFYSKHPEKARDSCRMRRARKVGLIGTVSKGIDFKLRELQRGRCATCKQILKKGATHLDHIVPLMSGGLHDDKNLQLLCKFCNLSKGVKSQETFMQTRGFLL